MRYEFIVQDSVPGEVAAGPSVCGTSRDPTDGTCLFDPALDGGDLARLVAHLSDLGLTVIEMRRFPD